jgi:hypothetical protein
MVPFTFVLGSVAVMVVVDPDAAFRTVAVPPLTVAMTLVLLESQVTPLVMSFVAPPGE